MDLLLNEFRHALRRLRASPGFTVLAVLVLGLGIGATTSVFSIVQAVLLRSLPYPEADRLVDVSSEQEHLRPTARFGQTSRLTLYQAWRLDSAVFEDLAALTFEDLVLTGIGPAERVNAFTVTANFFPLLGGVPALGRLFTSAEDRPGSPAVAVLSHRFWVSRFGSDSRVLGRTITLDTTAYTVVGVTSPHFRFGLHGRLDPDVWLPLGPLLSDPAAAPWVPGRSGPVHASRGWYVVGRLRSGVTAEQAQARLDGISRQVWASDPGAGRERLLPIVMPLRQAYLGDVQRQLFLMLGAVALVLLVACANVGSLLASRTLARGPELAVRLALGASRPGLTRQLLVESAIVAFAGGVLGVLVTWWSIPPMVRLAGVELLPSVATVGVDQRVLAAALCVSLIAAALCGLDPALVVNHERVADALKLASGFDSVRRVPAGRGTRFSLVLQVVLTSVLLAGAGIMAKSFARLVNVDAGYDPSDVVTAVVKLPESRYQTPEQRVQFIQRALDELHAVPGVVAAALGSAMPIWGGRYGDGVGVTSEYFRVLRIPVRQGDDRGVLALNDMHAVVLSELTARKYFPGQDPVGKETTLFRGEWTGRVVAVTGDIRLFVEEAPFGIVYYPLVSRPVGMLTVLIRTTPGMPDPKRSLREAIQRVDPTVAADRVASMSEMMADVLARRRFYGLLLNVFAGCALVLAAAGIFASVSYAVAQRTRELGVRMALGAEGRDVVLLMVGEGTSIALVGTALGGMGSFLTNRLFRSFLYEVEPTDPLVLSAVAGLLLAVVAMASYLPARRAAAVDPMVALRSE